MKQIIIEVKDGKHGMKAVGLNNIEVMGLLRYYEKKCWLITINEEGKEKKSHKK